MLLSFLCICLFATLFGDTEMQAQSYGDHGGILQAYSTQYRDLRKAEAQFKDVMAVANRQRDTLTLIRVHFFLGRFYHFRDQRLLAADECKRALQLISPAHDLDADKLWITAFAEINNLTDPHRALNILTPDSLVVLKLLKAIELFKEQKELVLAAEACIDLSKYTDHRFAEGFSLKKYGYADAFKYIEIARELYEQSGFHDGIVHATWELAAKKYYTCLWSNGADESCQETLPAMERSLQMALKYDNTYYQARTFNYFAYHSLENDDYALALSYVEKAKALALKMQDGNQLVRYLYTYRDIYDSLNDFRMAYRYSDRLMRAKDSLYQINTAEQLGRIENLYENQLRDEKIKLLDLQKRLSERRLSQTFLFAAIVIICLLTAIVGLVIYLRQRQQTLLQLRRNEALNDSLKKNLEDQLINVQLQALQAQMSPHFVFNVLNSIQNLVLRDDKMQAIHYLNDFAQLTRITLENSRRSNVKIKDEIQFLKRYLELESLRHGSKFDYEIKIDKAVDQEFETIPPMIIQPFVENSVKHGLAPKSTKGFVSIHFRLLEDASSPTIVCEIRDNGIGRKASAARHSGYHHSFATEAMETRLQLLAQRSQLLKNYRIDIEDLYQPDSTAAGTAVTVYIPLIKNMRLA